MNKAILNIKLKTILARLNKPIGYFLYACLVVGIIYGLLIVPVFILTEKFGFLWGIVWLLVLALLAYLGRDLEDQDRLG